MLILTRKKGEKVTLEVGDIVITVSVTAIEKDFVRLGFDAPDSVAILRDDAKNRKKKEDNYGNV